MSAELFEFIHKNATNYRERSFERCCYLAIARNAKIIIETGTYRGTPADGCSTLIFALLAKYLNASFFSVDIDQNAINKSKEQCGELLQYVNHHCTDSLAFLSAFNGTVDVLYLDSYDYNETTPLPAQMHQLAELGATWHNLVNSTVILLDDCNLPGGGKSGLSDPFLKERGWNLVFDEYQKLFTKA